MTNYEFVLESREVFAAERLTLREQDEEGTTTPLKDLTSISHDDLALVRARLLNQVVRFNGTENDIDKELAEQAVALIEAASPTTNVKTFLVNNSRPYLKQWLWSADRYLHPSTDGQDVCVSFETWPDAERWYHLEIRARQVQPAPMNVLELTALPAAAPNPKKKRKASKRKA